MSAVVVFEWSFSPPDYFEVPIGIVRDDYTLTIAHGKAEARLDSAAYEANPSIRQALHEGLNDRFLGVQLLTHRAYELSRSTMTRVHPDGRKDFSLEAEPGRIVITGHPVDFQDPKEFDDAFTMAAKERITAMIVLRDPFTVRHRALIAESAVKLRVPAIYETADYVQAGGLMFYGPDFAELYRRSAAYVGKILKGAKPADLPVEQPTKFELVINMKTAKALGLTVPTSLLLQTDRLRIIE